MGSAILNLFYLQTLQFLPKKSFLHSFCPIHFLSTKPRKVRVSYTKYLPHTDSPLFAKKKTFLYTFCPTHLLSTQQIKVRVTYIKSLPCPDSPLFAEKKTFYTLFVQHIFSQQNQEMLVSAILNIYHLQTIHFLSCTISLNKIKKNWGQL